MADQLLDTTVTHFLDTLASNAPTPGGGSVAALSGALAAGLLTMVCDLTIGKKQYADVEDEIKQLREQAEAARATLQQLVQGDVEAFNRLSVAYKLPRVTDADAATRRAAIQTTTRNATEVPLRIAQAALVLLPLCTPLAQKGSRNAVSDVGVAAQLIRAAVPSALLNVDINLPVLEDKQYVREARARADDMLAGLDEEVASVMALVHQRIAA